MNYPYKHNECECANKYHCLFDFAAAAITDTSHFVPPLTDLLGGLAVCMGEYFAVLAAFNGLKVNGASVWNSSKHFMPPYCKVLMALKIPRPLAKTPSRLAWAMIAPWMRPLPLGN
jgi:hypothetical protein